MKQLQFITLSLFIVFFTAWDATAFGPPNDKGPFNSKQLQRIQTVLDLTDEQNAAVKYVFANARKEILMTARNSHLGRKEMAALPTLIGEFRQDGQKQLATVLSEKEIQVIREKLFAANPLRFILLSSAEKQGRLEDTLGLDTERASKVTAILEQKKAQHEQTLADLGFDLEQIINFQQALIAQRQDVKKSLKKILSPEQMELFEKTIRQ